MRFGKLAPSLLAAMLLLIVSSESQAALIYTLRFGQPGYMVTNSEIFTINFFLREEATDGSTPRFDNSNGLLQGNVGVSWDDTSWIRFSDVTPHPQAVSPSIEYPTTTEFRLTQSFNAPGAIASIVSSTIREIQLGSFQMQAAEAPSGSLISFFDFNTGSNNDLAINTAGGSVGIDSVVQRQSSHMANPEPSSLLLLGASLATAAFCRRLRKSRAVVTSG